MTTNEKGRFVAAIDVAAKIVIAIVAGVWVLYTYPDMQEKEFRKAYWDRQMTSFFDASQTVSKIATLSGHDEERKVAERKFWELYWGQMTIVESKCERCDPVDQAMISLVSA